MKTLTWIEFLLGILTLVFILIDQYGGEKAALIRDYFLGFIGIVGLLWLFSDYLQIEKDKWTWANLREITIDKKDILICAIIAIIIGYFGGHEGEKPPHEIWLDNNKYIAVVHKPRGSVYTFEPIGDGYYKLFLVNKQVNNEK